MLNSFPNNPRYSFRLNGTFQLDGVERAPGMISIDVGDRVITAHTEWLALLSHYEVAIPGEYLQRIFFVECKSRVLKLKCGQWMQFRKPIPFEDGFYYIPGFTRFALNKEQVLISVKTKRIHKVHIGPYGYPCVNVYDSDKRRWRTVALHLLVARTFVPNGSPEDRYFVNHINGVKTDSSESNLEWVTSYENQIHAVNSGLRNDNIPCAMLDVVTDQITCHRSVRAALSSVGIKRWKEIVRTNGDKIVPELIAGRYEIKRKNDMREWFYRGINPAAKRSPVACEARNVINGEVLTFETITDLASAIKACYKTVWEALRSPKLRRIGNYLIRYSSNANWSDVYYVAKPNKARTFSATNKLTGETMTIVGRKQACHFLDLDKKTLARILKKNLPWKGWCVEEIVT